MQALRASNIVLFVVVVIATVGGQAVLIVNMTMEVAALLAAAQVDLSQVRRHSPRLAQPQPLGQTLLCL